MSALARLADPISGAHLGALAFRASAASHVGCVRTLNEDAWLDRSEVGLWAVADGVGGHAAGDFASQEVIRSLNRVADFSSAFAFRRNVRNSLFNANAVLQRLADREMLDSVGSTVVALIAHGGYYACTWAGDSRAYLLRDGELTRITTDHSLAQELVSTGKMSYQDAGSLPKSNVITRAVGARPTLELDGVYGRIELGDRFLLCSDGLFGVLNDFKIRGHLGRPSAEDAVQQLIEAALALKATDNITCVVIDVEQPRL